MSPVGKFAATLDAQDLGPEEAQRHFEAEEARRKVARKRANKAKKEKQDKVRIAGEMLEKGLERPGGISKAAWNEAVRERSKWRQPRSSKRQRQGSGAPWEMAFPYPGWLEVDYTGTHWWY